MIETILQQAAAAGAHEAEKSGDLLGSVGINVQLLIFQVLGFLVLLFILSKWIFPVFMRIIDEREAKIEESLEAAHAAEKNANKAQDEIEAMLAEARTEAKDIVTTAKDEATQMLSDADAKAKANAEHTLKTAQDEIEKEVLSARKMLQNEAVDLVAAATEKVTANAYAEAIDDGMIKGALKSAKGAK